MTADQIAAAHAETERLTHELDITNADHIALWLEANMADSSLAWLACRIVEAHEAAISEPASVAVEAEKPDERLQDDPKMLRAAMEIWFSRDLVETQRRQFINICGLPGVEANSHGLQMRCLRYILTALSKPTPVEAGLREMQTRLRAVVLNDAGQTLAEAMMDGLETDSGDDFAGTLYQACDRLALAALTETQPPRETSTETKESGE